MPTIQYSVRSAWLSVRLSIRYSQSNLTRRIATVDGWFNVIWQVTAKYPPMRAHWRHLANTTELVHPSATAVHNRNTKLIGSVVSVHMTVEYPYSLQWSVCFPLKLSLSMLAFRRHVIRTSLGPPEFGAQMGTSSLQPFFQGWLVWHTDRATVRPTDQATRCDMHSVIMHNYVWYSKATHSFDVSTNNLATISRYLYI